MVLSGGTAVIDAAVSAGQVVSFVGSGGELILSAPTTFSATIGGFAATGQTIDLGGFAYSPSETKSFVEAPSATSGTLTITDGSQTAKLTLLGSYVTSNFTLATDGNGGTLLSPIRRSRRRRSRRRRRARWYRGRPLIPARWRSPAAASRR